MFGPYADAVSDDDNDVYTDADNQYWSPPLGRKSRPSSPSGIVFDDKAFTRILNMDLSAQPPLMTDHEYDIEYTENREYARKARAYELYLQRRMAEAIAAGKRSGIGVSSDEDIDDAVAIDLDPEPVGVSPPRQTSTDTGLV